MYRCIVFVAQTPAWAALVPHNYNIRVAKGEGETPEQAMADMVVKHTAANIERVTSSTTWQPSSGLVFLDGKECGVVCKVNGFVHG